MPLQEVIKVSTDTKQILDNFKIVQSETYDEVIQRLIQAVAEQITDINDETKEALLSQIQKVKEGRVNSFNDFLKKLRNKKGVTSARKQMDGKKDGMTGEGKKSYPRGDPDVMGS